MMRHLGESTYRRIRRDWREVAFAGRARGLISYLSALLQVRKRLVPAQRSVCESCNNTMEHWGYKLKLGGTEVNMDREKQEQSR
jgi:hypothetical protein